MKKLLPIVGIILVIAGGFWFINRSKTGSEQTGGNAGQQTPGGAADQGKGATTASGLRIEDLVTGSGTEAVAGKNVTVHYTGWLQDGKKFDSSLDRGQPFKFVLGAGQVIPGWDQGVTGMKVGGKRKLTIPPQMGYGDRGVPGVIPPNSVLVFEVELLGVE